MAIRNEAPARANATEAPNTDPIPSSNLAATPAPINRRRMPEDVLYERERGIYVALLMLEAVRDAAAQASDGRADPDRHWYDQIPGEILPPAPMEMEGIAPAEALLLSLAIEFADAYSDMAAAVKKEVVG